MRVMIEKIRLPRILITNDDGIDAPGLELLTEIAADIADEVWVIAPERDRSGVSMKISLHEPLRIQPRGARRFAVAGTPADCVALACHHFLKPQLPQLLLSGINTGVNCGDDVNLSGTVGAALTGLMFGIPSIAISQSCLSRKDIRWDTARAHIPALLQTILQQGWRKDTCLSVNLPDADPDRVSEVAWTRQSSKNMGGLRLEPRVDLREGDYYWLAFEREKPAHNDNGTGNGELAALKRNQITVTCLSLDRSVNPGRQVMPLYPDADHHAAS